MDISDAEISNADKDGLFLLFECVFAMKPGERLSIEAPEGVVLVGEDKESVANACKMVPDAMAGELIE